jgi:aminocarboxymuconate-semialdehyde decarboxylase
VTVVDLHTHFLPRFFVEEAAAEGVFGVRVKDGLVVHPQGFRYPAHPTFVAVESKLAAMDATGIDVSVLSSAPTLFFYDQAAEAAVAFARRSNDALAELVAESDRLAGLAALPLQDPDASAEELERAVGELGLLGAHIGTNGGKMSLDAPQMEPVLAAAERLDVPLMLHPYYVGPKAGLEDFYLVNSMGNPLDTSIAAVRLIHAGSLDRFPALRVALVHAGGFLPYQIGRFDHAWSVRPEARVSLDRPPSEYLDRFWMDTITHGDEALRFLADLIDPDRLYIGTDEPFDMADSDPVLRLERVGIDVDATACAAAALLNTTLEPQRAAETGGATWQAAQR